MSKKIDELTAQMNGKWQEIDEIRKTVVKEDREFTTEERDQVEEGLDTIRNIEVQIEKARSDQNMIDQINDISKLFSRSSNGQRNGRQTEGKGFGGSSASLGSHFISAPEWQNWLKVVAPNGRIPDSAKGLSSPPVEVKDFGLFRKDLITGLGDTSAGAFVDTDRTGIYEPLGRYPLTLRDLISVRQTGSDTVAFVRQLTQVTQAAPVPEANVTTYTGATGQVQGLKPEGSMTFDPVTETVKTIAVWVPATKRALSDAAQLRGLIDAELREDLAEELENQMLNGDGNGENFTGVAATANTLAQAFDTDIEVTARKALTNLLVNGKSLPTAWVLSPLDWEAFDLSKDLEGRYRWGGPMAQGPRMLWGVPVVQSFFQPQGSAWLADWRKAVLWDREAATISVSDSHADFFIRNMVAILAEMRAAFGVIRPSAFCEVDLDAGS